MSSSNPPSGPGRPVLEQIDAVAEREQIDEMSTDEAAKGESTQQNAKNAERGAKGSGERGTWRPVEPAKPEGTS